MMSHAAIIVAAIGVAVFQEPFQQANDAYAAGDYDKAIQIYERFIGEGVTHAAVFYNLGNAYYRKNAVGPAVANYERALYVDPDHYQAAHNLDLVISQTQRQLPRPLRPPWKQSLLFWDGSLAPRSPLWLAMGGWIAFWILVAIRTWRPVRYLRIAAAILLILTVLFTLSAWAKTHPDPLAVVAAESLPVRFRTDGEATVRFELSEGDRVILEIREGEWARVLTATGERGWCMAKDLIAVGPPFAARQANAS
jgi:hypothetical protein